LSAEATLEAPPPPAAADRVFRALGDPTRRAMLERLSERPMAAKQLQALLGITLTAVIQHVGVLEDSGLVHSEKIGRTRTCRLRPEGLSVAADWIAQRRALWERRLDRLGDILDEEAS
jgi:DNA-binding transcriptional ArsR family regulator